MPTATKRKSASGDLPSPPKKKQVNPDVDYPTVLNKPWDDGDAWERKVRGMSPEDAQDEQMKWEARNDILGDALQSWNEAADALEEGDGPTIKAACGHLAYIEDDEDEEDGSFFGPFARLCSDVFERADEFANSDVDFNESKAKAKMYMNASSRDAWFVEVARMLMARLNPEKYAAPEHEKGALKTNAVVLLCTQVYLIRSMLDIAMERCEERASLANELAEGGGEGESEPDEDDDDEDDDE